MELFRGILCIIWLLAAPFLMGVIFGKKTIAGTYISGVLLLWGSFELVSMAAVIKGWDLKALCKWAILVWAAFLVVGAVVFCVKMPKKEKPFLKEGLMILPAFCLVGSLFFIYAPKLESWYLVPETVTTILDTNSLHGFNPLTGQPLGIAKSFTDSLCNLSAFYACLAQWLHVDTGLLLFKLIPLWVLLISFLVFYQFALLFFEKSEKCRILFMWIYAFVLLFGDKAYMNEAYQMLHYAYEGRAVLTGILLPYCFYLFAACFVKEAGTGGKGTKEVIRGRLKGQQVCRRGGYVAEYVLVLLSGLFAAGMDYGAGLLAAMTVIGVLSDCIRHFFGRLRKVGNFKWQK